MVIALNLQKCWKLLTGQFSMTILNSIFPFPCSSHLDNLIVHETLKTLPPQQLPGKVWGKGQIPAPGQIFWSNALPLGSFQRSNPQRPSRFSIFLLLMNNLSLRFQRRCFLPAVKKKLIPKKTHMYTKPNRLFIKYILVSCYSIS